MIALVSIAIACGGGSSDLTLTPTRSPTPTPAPATIQIQETVLDSDESRVRRGDLPGNWLAFGEGGTWVKISENGTYRFGPDVRQSPSVKYDDFVFEQGSWELQDGVLSFVSSEFSLNCRQGQRGDYQVTMLEDGNVMLDREQDQCPARSHKSVLFERTD